MTATHTPGPWRTDRIGAILRPIQVTTGFLVRPRDGDAPALAILKEGRRDVQEANARLMAAAPDLLEALDHACAYLDSLQAEFIKRNDILVMPQADLDGFRAAIAKAKGA